MCDMLATSKMSSDEDLRMVEETAIEMYGKAQQVQRIAMALVKATSQSMRFDYDPAPPKSSIEEPKKARI
jgi:hypothetical protein